jgi:hypothetical protein
LRGQRGIDGGSIVSRKKAGLQFSVVSLDSVDERTTKCC